MEAAEDQIVRADEERSPAVVHASLTACVLVPTFKRPEDLRRCILAVAAQQRLPDEFIIVVRDIDVESAQVVREYAETLVHNSKMVVVTEPGQVHALSAGLASATTDIVAITDDDAAPHADWLAKIVAMFESDERIGGVGGRDLMRVNGQLLVGRRRTVGHVPSVGPHLGNHHLGYGLPREVDVIKGVNGSYRRTALASVGFDRRLRGKGAQVHWEISLGLELKRRGWKIVYDPNILVDHFLAPRFDEDQRNSFNALALSNAVFNETLLRLEQRSAAVCVAYLLWAVAIGTRAAPGLVQFIRFSVKDPSLAFDRLRASLNGRFAAVQRLAAHERRTL